MRPQYSIFQANFNEEPILMVYQLLTPFETLHIYYVPEKYRAMAIQQAREAKKLRSSAASGSMEANCQQQQQRQRSKELKIETKL